MTLPTTQPINGSDDDSDMFGPPRSSPPIGYHHHRSKVPMISPKLRLREERKRIIQLCAHKLERIKDSEANLRRSVCINNTYSRLNDEVRREKQNRYLANLPKPDTKPETAHDNIFSPYNSCNGGNQNDNLINNNNLLLTTTNLHHNHHHQQQLHHHHQQQQQQQQHHNHHHHHSNDILEMYPNLNQNYHNLHHQQSSILHNSSNCSTTTTTATTSASSSSTSSGSGGLSTSISSSCALSTGKPTTIPINSLSTNSILSHHHHNSILSNSSSSCSSSSNNNNSTNNNSCQMTSSSSSSLTCNLHHDTNNSYNNNNNKKEKRYNSHRSITSCLLSSSNSVDTDLEILDRELSAIDASMPLIDPEITQGAEHLEKAVSSRKRLRSEDENDRLVREALSHFYLPTQRLISAIDDCPLDIKRSKITSTSTTTLTSSSTISSLSSTSQMLNGLHNGTMCNLNNHSTINNLNNHDIDLDLALDLNTNHKEFEVIMDALRLGTPSPTSSCGSDSCGQAAMMSESGGGVFHNLVVTSLET